jgi:hypothetical protein
MRVNFAEIKKVSIVEFLAHVGVRPVRDYAGYALYHAPYRKDVHPSFKVSKSKNRWYDLALCEGGDIIDLGRRLYNTNDIFDVVERIIGFDSRIVARRQPSATTTVGDPDISRYNIQENPLTARPLLSYIATRGIDFDVARKYCVELHYSIGGRRYYALGFKNIRNGYEVRNARVKSCLGCKDITIVKSHVGSSDCVLFEGFTDFLSYLTLFKRCGMTCFTDTMDFVILNSVSNIQKAIPWLMRYEVVSCCLDNDDAGRKAVDILSELHDGIHDISAAYAGYKDINDLLIRRPYCP